MDSKAFLVSHSTPKSLGEKRMIAGLDRNDEISIIRNSAEPAEPPRPWRNWQTRSVEVAVGVKSREGSTPFGRIQNSPGQSLVPGLCSFCPQPKKVF